MRLADYLELSKARIVLMVLVTTAAGFALAPGAPDFILLIHTLAGTALIAAGTNALNQYAERERDKKMERTALRPLPDGRISEAAALWFSIVVSVGGALWLAAAANWIASLLAVLTLLSYLFIYTPLKTRTPLCTVVGAVPGAIPPMIGWAAATGSLDRGAWVLFGLMFFWQLPHFLAIGWLYREDYARAGFTIASVTDPSGASSGRQAILYGLGVIPLSLAPAMLGIAGPAYVAVGVLAGAVLLHAIFNFARLRTRISARQLFITSNVYLVVVMSVLVASNALR